LAERDTYVLSSVTVHGQIGKRFPTQVKAWALKEKEKEKTLALSGYFGI